MEAALQDRFESPAVAEDEGQDPSGFEKRTWRKPEVITFQSAGLAEGPLGANAGDGGSNLC